MLESKKEMLCPSSPDTLQGTPQLLPKKPPQQPANPSFNQVLLAVDGGQLGSSGKAEALAPVPVGLLLHKVEAFLPEPDAVLRAAGKDGRGAGRTFPGCQGNDGDQQCCHKHGDPEGDHFVLKALEAKR